jgi:hypothetical protein
MTLVAKLSPKMREWIDARVSVTEDGCWLWKGATAHGGKDPKTWFEGKTRNTRRVMWNATHTKPLPRNMHVAGTCECERCVHPDHIAARTKSAMSKGRAQSAAHTIAIAKARRVNAKVSAQQVQEIRASEEPAKVIAARMGVHHTYIHDIRRHEAWRDYGSHFAGLFASNDTNRRAA